MLNLKRLIRTAPKADMRHRHCLRCGKAIYVRKDMWYCEPCREWASHQSAEVDCTIVIKGRSRRQGRIQAVAR
jgi:hypothetical protein